MNTVLLLAVAHLSVPFSGAYDIGHVPHAEGCHGRLELSLYRGARRLDGRATHLSSRCRYAVTFRPARSAVGSATRLTVVVRFGGNRVLGRTTNRFHVTLRKPASSPALSAVSPPLPVAVPPAAPVLGADPRGAILSAARESATQALLTGWTRDADKDDAALTVQAFDDGAFAGQSVANADDPAYGPHAFRILAGVTEGASSACVTAVNVGAGSDAQLGCLPVAAFGDLDANGRIGCSDLLILDAHKGKPGSYADGDLDGDGKVTSRDANLLAARMDADPTKCVPAVGGTG